MFPGAEEVGVRDDNSELLLTVEGAEYLEQSYRSNLRKSGCEQREQVRSVFEPLHEPSLVSGEKNQFLATTADEMGEWSCVPIR